MLNIPLDIHAVSKHISDEVLQSIAHNCISNPVLLLSEIDMSYNPSIAYPADLTGKIKMAPAWYGTLSMAIYPGLLNPFDHLLTTSSLFHKTQEDRMWKGIPGYQISGGKRGGMYLQKTIPVTSFTVWGYVFTSNFKEYLAHQIISGESVEGIRTQYIHEDILEREKDGILDGNFLPF